MYPSPSELDHFFKLYQYRHFTLASRNLGISQPALTQSINKLESKLGTPLFFRSRKGITPTKEATVLFAKITELSGTWHSIRDLIQDHKTGMKGVFRVGCHPSVGSYTLPNFFQKLSKSSTAIEIRLIHDHSRAITDKVLHHELDLGFVVNPIKHPDLIMNKLGNDEVCFWCRKDGHHLNQIFAD